MTQDEVTARLEELKAQMIPSNDLHVVMSAFVRLVEALEQYAEERLGAQPQP